ncbi:uncharacterized protein LOC131688874 isoform X1 [Topomyia yanbarensis]|uniref:uncharacterized protein LOC131688874 isoform X1 n=1 Tax=Topomyia yanbarensis TaxID=2498891 RepID=UPI00273B82F5|nr:uncharacterized protein LOC131688874 isoform X1 [Topomyia yanbarensis]
MEESQQLHFSIRHNHSGNSNNKPLKDNSLPNASGHDGSGHLADSGYNSYQSFNASSSVVRSVLATIEEDNEADSSFEELRGSETPLKCSSILTPTTAASIEQISKFHLTTPNSAVKRPIAKRIPLAHKPTCQNLFVQRTPEKSAMENVFESGGTPLRSGRKSTMGIATPRKNKSSAKRKLASFREKLYSDGDVDKLRSSPRHVDSLESDCKKLDQEDISPIFHSKRRRNSVIDDFMRSSTPKTASFECNFYVDGRENINWEALQHEKAMGVGHKPLTLRKFQSFSPSKMHSYRKRDTILQEKSINTNRRAPLRRQNAFQESSPRQFFPKSSTIQCKPSQEQNIESPRTINRFVPVKDISITALLDAPLLSQHASGDKLKESDVDHEISPLPSFDDCSFTPKKTSCTEKDLPQNDSVIREAPFYNASVASILENESPLISIVSIPRTPTSANKSRKLKRLSSRSLSSGKKDKPRSKPSSPKLRSQPTIPGAYRRSYVGVERLNILKRLNEHDKDALDVILDYLADSDLVQVVAVSRGWRSIILQHRRVNRRLRAFLLRESHIKENLDRTGSASRDCSLLASGKSLNCDVGKESAPQPVQLTRQPFSLCNSIDGSLSAMESKRANSVQKSPPVSPSKRKFRENQKIASHLKKSERLKACPRCEKPSRVVLGKSSVKCAMPASTVNLSAVTAKLEKSYTLPDASSNNSTNLETVDSPLSPNDSNRIRRNLFSTSLLPRSCSMDARITPVSRAARRRNSADTSTDSSGSLLERKSRNGNRQRRGDESQCDYAICSGKSCGFAFCIKCLCEFHPNSVCKDLAPNSPSKEEEPVHNVACSKQSRRSLLRLRK